jgi:hypothetical protein
MQKWEYKWLMLGPAGLFNLEPQTKVAESREIPEYLNTLGEAGWELTGIVSTNRDLAELFFKRPKP